MSGEKSPSRKLAEEQFSMEYGAVYKRLISLKATLREAEAKVEELERNGEEWITTRELFNEALISSENIKSKWRNM